MGLEDWLPDSENKEPFFGLSREPTEPRVFIEDPWYKILWWNIKRLIRQRWKYYD